MKLILYWIGRRIFQINGDSVYEWWKGSDYNTLTGTVRVPSIVFYVVADPAKVKIFNSIIVYLTGGEPRFNSIDIPEKATAGAGRMETNIHPVNIEEKEGVFYCQVLNDLQTPEGLDFAGQVIDSDWSELNGRKMRGLYARVSLWFSAATAKMTLSNIIAIITQSERSK